MVTKIILPIVLPRFSATLGESCFNDLSLDLAIKLSFAVALFEEAEKNKRISIIRNLLGNLMMHNFFISDSKKKFEQAYLKFKKYANKHTPFEEKGYEYELLEMHMYFQSYLFFVKAFLDVFAKVVASVYPGKVIPDKTFNKQLKWMECEKNITRFKDKKYRRYIFEKLDWFNMLKSLRDEFAHIKGRNIAISPKGIIFGDFSHNDRESNEVIEVIHAGLKEYISFCDKHWVQSIISADKAIIDNELIEELQDKNKGKLL